MTDLIVSFGGGHPAKVNYVKSYEWADFARALTQTPPETEDKAARGWYCPTEFDPVYRDSDNFVARHAITFDFDHVEVTTWDRVREVWGGIAFAMHTTWSHTLEKPRFRVVMPLSRPAGYDEFQAVARKVAADIGIELIARESFVPAQMMYMPTRKPGGDFASFANTIGMNDVVLLDVDAVLAEYADWTDRTQWPQRQNGDSVRASDGTQVPPDEKPGIVGDFCRAFTVEEAIEKFDLPYKPGATPGRYTYANGSVPEGAVVYDDGKKFHSHHDTDPARGQSNAFDLVRAHHFASLDEGLSGDIAVTERPSYVAMAALARQQPEVAALAVADFADLGPLTPEETPPAEGALARRISDVLSTPTAPDWLIADTIERGVIAILAGPRGSYKSFIALDWAMRTAVGGGGVYVISAEGGDFDRRAGAWLRHFEPTRDAASIPLFVAERRIDLSLKENVEAVRQDCVTLGVQPVLFVLDTFSKLSGGLDENDNTEVKAFIGMLDNGLKRGFGATVLLICHTGHSDSGRPRGASALAADTDAEYIAARNPAFGSVNVTRQRFKSSPELSPLCYRPLIVDLGRKDAAERPVTSLVMIEEEPPLRAGAKRPSGPVQQLTFDAIKIMSPHGESVAREDVIVAVVAKLTKPDGRDSRRGRVERAIDGLIASGIGFASGADRVALTPIEIGGEDEWLTS